MSEIKYISKDTDLSKICKLEWDVVCNGIPYDVYRVDGYIHTIGGKWGDNEYWCCESKQTPSYKTLFGFRGEVIQWGIEYIPHNYIRSKWNTESMENGGGHTIIKRNGIPFYSIQSLDMNYGISKAQVCLMEINEHSIPFHFRNFRNRIIGRKVYLREQPAIIERIIEDEKFGLSIFVIPDSNYIDKFNIPCYAINPENYENQKGERCDLLSSHIFWHRDDK